MSEIRKTTTIREVAVPPREPLISLEDVLAAVGWVAFQGTKLAVKGAVAGTKLAYRGGKALAGAIQEANRHATIPEVMETVKSSGSAREAVASLAAGSLLEVPERASRTLAARLETLVSNNDLAGVETVARQLVTGRQNRLQADLVPLVIDSCKAIGFEPQTVCLKTGRIVVQGQGAQSAVIDVARETDGGIRLDTDTEGFAGGACVSEFHEPFETELRKRGVHFSTGERRKKPLPRIRILKPVQICRR